MDDYDVTSQDQTNQADETPAEQATAAEQAPRRAPRRSRRATRPAGTPERPTLDVLAELGISAPDDGGPSDGESSPADVISEQPAEPEPSEEAPLDAQPEVEMEAEEAEPEEPEAETPQEAAEPEQDRDDAAEGSDDSPRLPATALLFQAPDMTPRRRRRASAPAGPPEAPAADETEQAPAVEAPVDQTPDADQDEPDEDSETAPAADGEGGSQPKRRRRRGGRGRRKTKKPADGGESAEDTEDEADDAEQASDDDAPSDADTAAEGDAADGLDEGEGGGGSRRRRRRRSRSGRDEGARARDEVTALKGSTRLEAKRQRRREGRDANRRRSIITEAEFLARRESVDRAMVVRERDGRTQIAVLEDDVLVEHFVARKTQTSMVGNVYLGRVQNVLPSMEAAFVDLGRGRNAVLYAGEVNWDAAGLEGQPRRIEQALSSGDSVLVQVTKDPIGHKGARLTSQITLAGRYLVLVPSGAMTGISRKLPDTERNRLKKLLKEIVPEGQGVIVRTAAEGASEEELRRDVERLTKTWADIDKKVKRSSTTAPVLLKGEPELSTRVVRDVFNEDFRSLTVQGDEAWKTISDYVGSVAPDLVERLHHWTAAEDVFASHRIDEQLAKGMDRKVWLPSGGSLVIDRTEAMTVVDVNTGKFTGSGGTLEETVTRNNLEAAEEIVRQLRLRDIGGIIVVDFIDMVLESNRDLVLRRLVECLGRDRTRHQVAEVTSLGLVQMTRKRVGQGLVEAFSTTCEHCHGRGFVLHDEPVESGSSGADDTDDAPRSGRGGRGGRGRGGRGQGGQQQPQPQQQPAQTVEDPAQRAQVRATLAAIAAAAAHAHEEHQLDSEPRPDGTAPLPPSGEDILESVVELSTEGVLPEASEREGQSVVDPVSEVEVADSDAADVEAAEVEAAEVEAAEVEAAELGASEVDAVDGAPSDSGQSEPAEQVVVVEEVVVEEVLVEVVPDQPVLDQPSEEPVADEPSADPHAPEVSAGEGQPST